jgi:hypothetical protein
VGCTEMQNRYGVILSSPKWFNSFIWSFRWLGLLSLNPPPLLVHSCSCRFVCIICSVSEAHSCPTSYLPLTTAYNLAVFKGKRSQFLHTPNSSKKSLFADIKIALISALSTATARPSMITLPIPTTTLSPALVQNLSTTQTPSSTQPPFLLTNADGVYVLTSVGDLHSIGTPVTILNSTQLHNSQVSDKVGSYFAFGILGCYALLLLVVLLAGLIIAIGRKYHSRYVDQDLPYLVTTTPRNSLSVPVPAVTDPERDNAVWSHAPFRSHHHRPKVPSRFSSMELSS